MNISDVNFTLHAIKRFMMRYEKSGFGKLNLEDANKKLIELLRISKKLEENNETFFIDEIVRVNKGWKFILNPAETILMTVERFHGSQN